MHLHDDESLRPALASAARAAHRERHGLFSPRACALLVGLLAAIALLSAPAPAAAQRQSGIQLGLDGSTILVSKDVGNERWTIAFDGSAIVSGNVYPLDGSSPSFVWCESSGRNDQGDYMLACYGAPSCTVGGCGKGAWTFIANVTVPASFFALPESGAAGGASAAAGTP